MKESPESPSIMPWADGGPLAGAIARKQEIKEACTISGIDKVQDSGFGDRFAEALAVYPR